MIGMDRHTGRALSGDAHLAQSITDILTTPTGTLVMQRDYGSDLPDIIDQPLNGQTTIDAYQAVAEALDLWEPRISIERVQIAVARPGYSEIDLTMESADGEEGTSLPIIVRAVA